MNQLDHIVIAAVSLTQGVEYLRNTLGVDVPKGGFHKTMGTYNHVMQLANDAYLEVIAVDPKAQAPRNPRWFGLDDVLMRASLRRKPRLIAWVMNTTDIHQQVTVAGFDIGTPTALSRDNLKWEIALTDDGRLLGGGMLPYCIQWHSSPHPSQGMADLGCILHALTIYHNRPHWIAERLDAMDAGHLVQIEALADDKTPYLEAEIETPNGLVILT
ncbi:MAG: VOC family protein [Gammaproteobacteria bacterium]|nr:VOC family protein [Gammaproteobacteria bacterium]